MKNKLRQEILEKRKRLSKEERMEKSQRIGNAVLSMEEFQKAAWIYTYIDMKHEVETKSLIQRALALGKKVAVPIAPKNKEMYFVEVKSLENLVVSSFGVLEPEASPEECVCPQKGDLFLVPGSVFDIQKNRIGYGGGYYDRYFKTYPGMKKIALAYDFQVLDQIPKEEFDIPMDKVVTEKRILG